MAHLEEHAPLPGHQPHVPGLHTCGPAARKLRGARRAVAGGVPEEAALQVHLALHVLALGAHLDGALQLALKLGAGGPRKGLLEDDHVVNDALCEHERLRRLCRDCGGAAICQHGRRRNHCRDCGGASICEHGRRRQLCRECGGASICEHGRQRTLCRECGGSSVCEHGRRRNHCRDCGGASICEHGRLRAHCRDCGNFACEIQGCPWQDLPFSGAQSLLRHMRAKHGDNPRSVTKSKELEVHQALRDAQITFEYQHHLPFRGCGLESETAHAYADFALPTSWGYVLLEVDEEQHNAYDPSCDARRDFDMAASVALGSGHKLLVLRYNPDAFKIAGVTRRTTKKERHAQLIRLLGELLAFRPPLSLLRPGRGEQRAALRGRALVRARARRVPLRLVQI